jgi:hypothetical protein
MQIQIYVMEVGERSRPFVRKCQNRPEKQSHFPPSFQSGQPPSRVLERTSTPPPSGWSNCAGREPRKEGFWVSAAQTPSDCVRDVEPEQRCAGRQRGRRHERLGANVVAPWAPGQGWRWADG